jgi:hypothetical protein
VCDIGRGTVMGIVPLDFAPVRGERGGRGVGGREGIEAGRRSGWEGRGSAKPGALNVQPT